MSPGLAPLCSLWPGPVMTSRIGWSRPYRRGGACVVDSSWMSIGSLDVAPGHGSRHGRQKWSVPRLRTRWRETTAGSSGGKASLFLFLCMRTGAAHEEGRGGRGEEGWDPSKGDGLATKRCLTWELERRWANMPRSRSQLQITGRPRVPPLQEREGEESERKPSRNGQGWSGGARLATLLISGLTS